MSDALLDIKALNAWYGESHVLHGVDLHIREGETVTLLGRNGAGKTTTLRAIMGILRRVNRERGLTLVVSQHQLETALEFGTRIVGFRAGRVVFDGAPAAVTPGVAAAIYGDDGDGARPRAAG